MGSQHVGGHLRVVPDGGFPPVLQAGTALQLVLPFDAPEVPRELRKRVRAAVASYCRPLGRPKGWIMLTTAQNKAVVFYLRRSAPRPIVAILAWTVMQDHLEPTTGEIMASRSDIARECGVRTQEVSEVYRCLLKVNAVQSYADVDDRRRVRYRINPNVAASFMEGAELAASQREFGPLWALDGGKA